MMVSLRRCLKSMLPFLTNALPSSFSSSHMYRLAALDAQKNVYTVLLRPAAGPSLFQLLIHSEDESRTGDRSCNCDTASAIHTLDAVLFPQRLAYCGETRLSACQVLDVFCLHSRLDRVGRIEHKVVCATSNRTGSHALPHTEILVFGRTVDSLEDDLHALVATKPCRAASCFPNQGSQLTVPVAGKTLVAIDRGNDPSNCWSSNYSARAFYRDLHLALNKFNGGEEQRSDCSSDHAAPEHA